MEKVRVVIAVEGGNISAVHAGSFVDLHVVNFNNLKAEGKTHAEREAIWAEAVGNTPSLW